MPRTGRAAAVWFRGRVGDDAFHLMCKAFVRTGLDVNPSRSLTAIECWREAVHKHPQHDPERYPAFVPAFMDTSASAEHVLFTVGRDRTGHRLAITTDGAPGNRIALIRLAELSHAWGPMIGWTEDLDGQPVWTPRPMISAANVRDAALHDPDVKGDEPLHPRAVGIIEEALVAERLLSRSHVNGRFGRRKRHAYAMWQTRTGFPATGIPELASLSRLGNRHGFDVH